MGSNRPTSPETEARHLKDRKVPTTLYTSSLSANMDKSLSGNTNTKILFRQKSEHLLQTRILQRDADSIKGDTNSRKRTLTQDNGTLTQDNGTLPQENEH